MPFYNKPNQAIKTLILLVLITCFACNKGVWVDNTYRAKRPHYSKRVRNFKANALINTHYMYHSVTTRSQTFDFIRFLGFYKDGRMFINPTRAVGIPKITSLKNSYENALYVGYYTTDGNVLKLEYLDGEYHGRYLEMTAEIRQDTLIFKEKSLGEYFKMNVSYDTLTVSKYPLKE